MNEIPATQSSIGDLFENSAVENGQTWWDAHWLMTALGYKDWRAFNNVINEAIGSCMRLGVPIADTFKQAAAIVEGQEVSSYKLNRFGCYLVAMHADIKKEEVLRIRGYLAAFAAALADSIQGDALHRVELREKLKDGESLMSGVAVAAGVADVDMGIFKDAGYQGMYNMGRRDLLKRRGLKVRDVLYDYMGVVELAAHNYRVTQTAERIRTRGLRGLNQAKSAALEVGQKVRRDIIENTGTVPESLPVEANINKVESGFRKTSKSMQKLDGKKKLAGGKDQARP